MRIEFKIVFGWFGNSEDGSWKIEISTPWIWQSKWYHQFWNDNWMPSYDKTPTTFGESISRSFGFLKLEKEWLTREGKLRSAEIDADFEKEFGTAGE